MNMEVLFYFSGILAIISTIGMIFSKYPVYAVLYLIVSLLSISCNLFSLRASFSGAIEVILYAGAIMVLFIFVIMMLNVNSSIDYTSSEYTFLSMKGVCGAVLLTSSLLVMLLCAILRLEGTYIDISKVTVSINQIGMVLFCSEYVLVVEMASFLLLGALISALHILYESKEYKNFNQISSDIQKEHR